MSRLQFTKAAPTANRAKVLLIGGPGKGKTHSALTFPKPAVIDAEGSIGWFSDRFEFESVATKSFAEVRELLAEFRRNPGGYETVVIDSLTTIYNSLTNATSVQLAAENIADFRPIDWGRIKKKFSSMLDELYYQVPLHVVCIGWIKQEYARPGSIVDGKKVKPNDLVAIGEMFDGDRKTEHAFDFIFKIEGNDGKKTQATVIKSRSGVLKNGQVIPDFSWKTLEPLFARPEVAGKRGMTDEEQAARDRSLAGDVPSNVSHYQVRLQSLKMAFRDAFGAQAKLSHWLESEGIAPGLSQRSPMRVADAEMDAAFSRLLDVSSPSIDDFDDAPPALPVTPPPATPPPIPEAIFEAANRLGILPLGVQADLGRHGGNVEALQAEYAAKIADMPQRGTPPAVAQADHHHRLTAAQKAHAAFDHWITKMYDHDGQLDFARKLFNAPGLQSYKELSVPQCETLIKTVREYQSANMPSNNGDGPCPVCGVPIGTKHFRECQAVAA